MWVRVVTDVLYWIDWCFVAYKYSLVLIVLMFIGHYMYLSMNFGFSIYGLGKPVFVALCFWFSLCLVRNGYGIG